MNALLLSIVLLAVSDSPARGPSQGGGGAGAPYEAIDAGDVFVATITRVEDKGATNANPPRVWFEVHEVLRGEKMVARSPAVWDPPNHGIDWGGADELLKAWEARPLKGPKVGEKLILGGRLYMPLPNQRAMPTYHLFSFVRIPYTDAARKQTIAHLALLDAERAKYAAEVAAAAKDREERGKAWRATMTDAVIDRRTQEADAVAIATVVGGDGYEVETLLKGSARMLTGGKYYVSLPGDGYDKRIADIIWNRPRVILFLSEKDLVVGLTGLYAKLVDPYEGMVLADDASIAAVKASLEKRPAAKSKPFLVISSFPRGAGQALIKAAQADFVVAETHQFSAHGEHVVLHIRKTLPTARYVVTIDAGPQRQVVAQEILENSAKTIYEATWPEKIGPEQAKELLGKLGAGK